ncbi:MAG TPA: hypothetical protein VGN31_11080 [Paraburkholderia sp.]|jgi:hypothetical protein
MTRNNTQTEPLGRAPRRGVGRFVVNTRAAPRRKRRRASRPSTRRAPADYAAAALSAFEYCNQTVDQFRTLVAVAATILRAPPANNHERVSRQTMLKLLLDTAEHYKRSAEDDRALFEVLVLDARNIHGTLMGAGEALKLLGERRTQSARCQV